MNANEHAMAERAAPAPGTGDAMSWPLLPIALRLKAPGWPAVWLPLLVLWPLFIALFCLALPLCVLLPPRRRVCAALGATYQVLCALHGTQVEVTGSDGAWNILLY